ncbi:hypothetical protein [Methanobrevibacter sp.]|uniref:hypothetical protein n=1 Tax=Methanobrevibacter sp. TaxID=66852 RepID=UPI00388D78FD
MELNKNVLAILAIFLLIVTAGVVSAANNASVLSNGAGNVINTDGNTAVKVNDVIDVNATVTNTTDTKVVDNVTNTTGNIVGNTTGNITDNATGNVTHNVTNTTVNATTPINTLQKLVTGNPFLAFLVVSAVLGGYTIIRRD